MTDPRQRPEESAPRDRTEDVKTPTKELTEVLADWREEYFGRRTVPYGMMRDLEDLVKAHDAALQTGFRQAYDALLAQYEQRLDEVTEDRDRLRDARKVRQQRSGLLDEQAKFTADIWTVSGLEEVAYLLRVAGLTDEDEIDLADDEILADVPDLSEIKVGARKPVLPPRQYSGGETQMVMFRDGLAQVKGEGPKAALLPLIAIAGLLFVGVCSTVYLLLGLLVF